MKFTKEMQDRIISWVEQNGLQPQPCGATLISLCRACGIDPKTFHKWEQKSAFSADLTRARATFAESHLVQLENDLIRAAHGAEVKHVKEKAKAEVITIVHKDGSKETRMGELKTVEAFRDTYVGAPDVRALQFALSNLAPDKWKLKQETTLQAQGVNIEMTLPQEAIDGLNHAIETGAKPRAPKDEE